MRPAISDSFISGQPLYLLYSKVNGLAAVPALIAASLPTQATGNVRLQVTGKPPTTRCGAFLSSDEHPAMASGSAAAAAPCSNCRRLRKYGPTTLAMPDVPVWIELRGSVSEPDIACDY